MSMNKSLVSVEEIIGTIKNSSLDSVIIEGDDDVIVYRRLEEIYEGLSVMPVGGRDNVLKIYTKLMDMKISRKIVFIVDRDMWIISGVPVQYSNQNFIVTDGYSIENDVIRDVNVEKYMRGLEKKKFREELEVFGKWYALEVKKYTDGVDSRIGTHPSAILDNPEFLEIIMKLKDEETYPSDTYNAIMAEYKRYIRGKSLLSLFMRQLSYKGRKPCHRHDSFLESAAVSPGEYVKRIFDEVGANLK